MEIGDWIARKPEEGNGYWYIESSGRSREIAVLYCARTEEELEVNAHLIAASPELLEACNKMWSYLITRPAKNEELKAIQMLCEKALAKAEVK